MENKTNQKNFLILQALFLFLIIVFGGLKANAAVTNYDEFDLGTLYNGNNLESDLIYNGSDVGDFTSAVFMNDSVFTYVLTVTPEFYSTFEFNMGRLPTDPDVAYGYNDIYGYSFSEAIAAFGTYPDNDNPPEPGDDLFLISIDSDNTIDWNTNTAIYSDYDWLLGETITFFFQHSSEPVLGFYNLASGPINPSVAGYVPAPVPIPGSLILLGSGLLILFRFRKK